MTLSPTCRALADDTRRAILDLLRRQGPLRAGDIAAHLAPLSRPAVSRHLRVLREAGLLRVEARGAARLYALDPGPLASLADWLRPYGAR